MSESPPPPGNTPPPPPPSSGSGPGWPSGGAGGTAAADLGVRFGARLIDGILVGVVNVFIGIIIGVGGMFALGGDQSAAFGVSLVAGLVGLLITFAYFVGMETQLGWTIGKKLLSLEVRGAGGGLPTVEESLKRNGWMALQVVPFIGGLAQLGAAIYIAITINSADDNRGWHDEFAGTVVPKV